MSHKTLDDINDLFKEMDALRPEKLEGIILQMFSLFNDLKTKMASPNEEERAEATQVANELKIRLEEQAYELCQTAGIDTTALEEYMNDPSYFSEEEWQVMQSAKNTFKEVSQKLNHAEEGV